MNKQPRTSDTLLSRIYIGLSLVSLGLLVELTVHPPNTSITFHLQKQLIGSIFAAICLIGILVGIFPSKCTRVLHFRSRNENVNRQGDMNQKTSPIAFRGHHPIRGNFSAHTIQLRGNIYCAGCTGLILGAIISLFGIFLYAFFDFTIGENSMFAFYLGIGAVGCGLLQYHILDLKNGALHFFLNVTFVLGAFLLLVGVHEITGNFLLEVYLFALLIYWIILRILISQLKHRTVCATCDVNVCGEVS